MKKIGKHWIDTKSRHTVQRPPDNQAYFVLASARYQIDELMSNMDQGIMFTWEGYSNPISQMAQIVSCIQSAQKHLLEFTDERRAARKLKDQGFRAPRPDVELPKQPLNMTNDDWDRLEETLPYPICSPPNRRTPCVRTRKAHLAFDDCQACGEDKLLAKVLDARPPAKYAFYCRDCIIAINKDNSDAFDKEMEDVQRELS